MIPYSIMKLSHYWLRQCLIILPVAPNYYLNQCCLTIRNKSKSNENKNTMILIKKSENTVCKVLAILFRPQWVKTIKALNQRQPQIQQKCLFHKKNPKIHHIQGWFQVCTQPMRDGHYFATTSELRLSLAGHKPRINPADDYFSSSML